MGYSSNIQNSEGFRKYVSIYISDLPTSPQEPPLVLETHSSIAEKVAFHWRDYLNYVGKKKKYKVSILSLQQNSRKNVVVSFKEKKEEEEKIYKVSRPSSPQQIENEPEENDFLEDIISSLSSNEEGEECPLPPQDKKKRSSENTVDILFSSRPRK